MGFCDRCATVFSAPFLLAPLPPARLSSFTRYLSVFISGYLRNDVQVSNLQILVVRKFVNTREQQSQIPRRQILLLRTPGAPCRSLFCRNGFNMSLDSEAVTDVWCSSSGRRMQPLAHLVSDFNSQFPLLPLP